MSRSDTLAIGDGAFVVFVQLGIVTRLVTMPRLIDSFRYERIKLRRAIMFH